MERFGNYRRFRDPHDLKGIPSVKRRRGIPVRETPLEGTKQLLSPKTGDLRQLVAGTQMTEAAISTGAMVCGWLALGLAALLLPGYLLGQALQGMEAVGWRELADNMALVLIAVFFLSHVCAGLSQLISNGRESNGLKGLMLCWASLIMMAVAEWVIALFFRALV